MYKIKSILKYGILAPSSYNSQPWKFKISKEKIEVFLDFSKIAKVIDPSARELYISGGAVLTNIEVAAHKMGYETDIRIASEKKISKKLDKIADIILTEVGQINDKTNNNLFQAIKKRQTNRKAFEQIEFDENKIKTILEIDKEIGYKIYNKETDKKKMASMIASASLYWYEKKNFKEELIRWLRKGDRNSLDGVWEKYYADSQKLGLLSYAQDKAVADEILAMNSPALAVIYSKNDSKAEWVKTGMYLEEILLVTTGQNIQHAYFNSIVESDKHRLVLGKMIGEKIRPQIVLRLGKAKKVRKSPRRKLASFLIN